MKDVHVHFLHGNGGKYTTDFFEGFICAAQKAKIDEIYLLEHTFQFFEFDRIYEPIRQYNDFQRDWLLKKMNGSIEGYLRFIDTVRNNEYPIKIKFGLEVCYIPEMAEELSDVLKKYSFDFLTGSVHWIDGWGFDHPKQKEIWQTVDIDQTYLRYYQIMCELCKSGLFGGLAHPDSIKCFRYLPSIDLTDTYIELATLLNEHNMYAENSGGLRLNYSPDLELGLNKTLLNILKKYGVKILPASDAHKQCDVGANIKELQI